jgi:hypothetical protein
LERVEAFAEGNATVNEGIVIKPMAAKALLRTDAADVGEPAFDRIHADVETVEEV